MKFMKLTVLAVTFLMALPAVARDKILIENALNNSLKERDQVQRAYKRSDAERREKRANTAQEGNRRIKIEMGDELESASAGAPSAEVMAFRSKVKEQDVSVNVDSEMADVDRAVKKDLKRGLDSVAESDVSAPSESAAGAAVSATSTAPQAAPENN